MTRWSLTRRLSIASVVTVGATVAAFGVAISLAARRTAFEQFDGGLAQRAFAWTALVEFDDEDGYEMELPPTASSARPTYVQVWCPTGTVLARSPSLGDADLPVPADGLAALTLPDGRRGRAVALRFTPRSEGETTADPCTVVLAEGTEDVDAAVAATRRWLIIAGVLAALLAAAIVVPLVRRGLRPLRRLRDQLETIDGTTLATRVELRDPPAELAAPVATLNQLLDRLDRAFARERQFTADVSHELRTPLAGLRAQLELTTLTPTSTEAYRATVDTALAIVADLTTLVNNLLALARADHGPVRAAAAPVALGGLIDDLWRRHAPVAAARQLELRNHVPAALTFTTDRELAAIIVGNLLDNAVSYTETGGWIEVTADAHHLAVIDSGPPIPAADLPRLFDRMWRGDAARSAIGLHSGIGLALARALATNLGWSITAANRDDGAVVFTITLAPPRGNRAGVSTSVLPSPGEPGR